MKELREKKKDGEIYMERKREKQRESKGRKKR